MTPSSLQLLKSLHKILFIKSWIVIKSSLLIAIKASSSWNIPSGSINDNLPEIIELYGNNSRKITCDIYIDDRNMKPEELVGAS